MERRSFDSYDGTRIAYYVAGPDDGIPLVIAAGLGGGICAWRRILGRFHRRMRVVDHSRARR